MQDHYSFQSPFRKNTFEGGLGQTRWSHSLTIPSLFIPLHGNVNISFIVCIPCRKLNLVVNLMPNKRWKTKTRVTIILLLISIFFPVHKTIITYIFTEMCYYIQRKHISILDSFILPFSDFYLHFSRTLTSARSNLMTSNRLGLSTLVCLLLAWERISNWKATLESSLL